MAVTELNALLNITFISKRDVPKQIQELFIDGETADYAYATLRDTAVFTNHRLIIVDTQGVTGTKKEYYSIPYRSIDTWSVETSGILDINGEVDLWTKVGHIKIQLRKGINVKEVDSLIATSVFNSN